MPNSPNLVLPYIEAAQAQKHVTHNDGLRVLDAAVQLSVLDRDLTSPPASPSDGDRYIPASGATGDWSGKDLNIAAWQDGAWAFLAPREGWLCWVADEDVLVVWDGSQWIDAGNVASLNPASGGLVGVNATADTTNRLSVTAPAALFNAEVDNFNFKGNKSAVGDTVSFQLQQGFTTYGEFGLIGDNDLSFKVSDGTSFFTSFKIGNADGEMAMEQPLGLKAYSKSSLPPVSPAGRLIWVWDDADGAQVAYSDGGGWKRIKDGTAVA
ncbi:DUF2793 domain-containing protein [Dichotomicrobium thermohalophilum]|uniref:Uncharacterized protein DUF2793 n=1 Tax=Dichotomicrobium thermohalophilum TaxID=933063 RepID=A0A397QEP2_9HYPH|nr:DUF2793 domain-containing protein [Dichotomicrobium thermohalophilum]RIA56751.1 uncharacterized protein DUF2793 [Dichotomicrobium thermohalophilum]